jgi:hypothetical protein
MEGGLSQTVGLRRVQVPAELRTQCPSELNYEISLNSNFHKNISFFPAEQNSIPRI